jgi:Raf kinase inhibitor-like YbhB/YbcL family protein
VTLRLPDFAAAQRLEVSSPEFGPDGAIPEKHSEYGQKFSPPLRWSKGPEGTRSYVVLMEDPDAPAPAKPFIHWIAYGIPAEVTQIRGALPAKAKIEEPLELKQGLNSAGSMGWSGMKPKPGDQPHRYHFQVFALDRELDLDPGATREEVLTAMRGHVLAAGELVGSFGKARQ